MILTFLASAAHLFPATMLAIVFTGFGTRSIPRCSTRTELLPCRIVIIAIILVLVVIGIRIILIGAIVVVVVARW